MAKVLITGASGYIGQHLSLALAASGWEVRGLSRSPRPSALDNIEWVQGDVVEAEVVNRATAGCAVVIHLACLSLEQSARNPSEALRVNVGGTLQALEAARRTEMERFVYISSGQVYGGQATLPDTESQLPQPDSSYGASKLCGEVWCRAYAQAYGIPVQILRLFNVYGAAADEAPRPTVEAIFVRQLRQGQRPQVRGNPQSGRDFIHVRDVVRAIGLCLACSAWEGPVNVGTGVLTTLNDLARVAAHVLGQTIEPEVIETGELPVRFQADTARAQALLGFRAEVPLEIGLSELARGI